MYTGRTIEDLLELVLEIVERVGGVVLAGPGTTLSSSPVCRRPDQLTTVTQAQETGLHR